MNTKKHIIGVRVDALTWERLERYEKITGSEKVALARTVLIAALDLFESKKGIKFPIKVVEAEAEWPTSPAQGQPANPDTRRTKVIRARPRI